MSRQPIKTWVVVIGGFTQRENSLSGIVRLWRDLHARMESAEAVVSLRTWNSRWADLAEHIFLIQQDQGERLKVAVFAYSWGAGFGFVQLSKELNRRGIPVEVAVLSDPVYCSPWYSFRWLAMTSWRKIVVPNNVRVVQWFFQRQDKPQSQGLVCADPQRTQLVPGEELDRSHVYMDDSNQFHEACHAAAEALWSA